MTHKLKKFNKSIVGKALEKVRGKEYKDEYGNMPEIKIIKMKGGKKVNGKYTR